MANEITISASISVYKPSVMSSAIGRSVSGLQFNMAGTYTVGPSTILLGTVATAFPLGQVTAPHWIWVKNLDANNFIKIRNGAGGADLPKLFPGEFALIPILDTAVPYGIADTAACLCEYMFISL